MFRNLFSLQIGSGRLFLSRDTYDGDGYGAKFKKRFLDLTDDDITAIYNSARKCSDDERKALEKKHGKNSDAARFFNEYKVDMERSEFIKKAMHNVQERRRTIEQRNIQAKAQKEREEAQKRQEQDKKSFIAENMNTALALLKNSYFASYPKGQGYPPIGKSLETFFARPTWEITPGKLGALSSGWIAKFHGIAELKNGNKARFTWAFFIDL